MEPFVVVLIAFALSFAFGYGIRQSRVTELEQQLRVSHTREKDLEQTSDEAKRRTAELRCFVEETLNDWKKNNILLPHLVEWSDRLQEHYDSRIERALIDKPRPALKGAEEVKKARKKSRQLKRELELLRPQLKLYESLAPWLPDYTDYSVEELLEALAEERSLRKAHSDETDPVRLFVPRSDWARLSERERNQLALDRYWDSRRRQSAWMAGVQFERYVGYCYESQGFKVEYFGALRKKEDLGIDLICKRRDETFAIQCKRLSSTKGIPVRENTIAQIFGAAKYYEMTETHSEVTPVLVTSFECSTTAAEFAKFLGVVLHVNWEFKRYPAIKCNITPSSGERIYHLPFDQMYDKVVIGNVDGEFYADSVTEAESAGFRRAFKWRGEKA